MGDTNLALDFNDIDGEVDISERGDPHDDCTYKGYSTIRLAERTIDNMDLIFTLDPELGLAVSMRAYHVADDEAKRHYHALLDTVLDWDQIRHLRDFLTCVLEWKP